MQLSRDDFDRLYKGAEQAGRSAATAHLAAHGLKELGAMHLAIRVYPEGGPIFGFYDEVGNTLDHPALLNLDKEPGIVFRNNKVGKGLLKFSDKVRVICRTGATESRPVRMDHLLLMHDDEPGFLDVYDMKTAMAVDSLDDDGDITAVIT